MYLTIPREDFEKNVRVDVSKWTKTKQGLSYLPWCIALGLLRSYNPDLYVGLEQDSNTGTPFFSTEHGVYLLAYVFSRKTGERTPSMFHAVRGYNNKADVKPTIDTIQNQMQRAFAKVIALETGLGWSLYSRIDESIDLEEEKVVPMRKVKQNVDEAFDF